MSEQTLTYSVAIPDPDYQAAVAEGLPPLGQGVDRTLVVLGPPRSGTSLVAGLLHQAGVHLGSKVLTEPQGHAPRGLYEDDKVLKLNDLILVAASGSRTLPPPVQNFRLADFRATIDGLVRFEQREVWGLKDPALCLTLMLWEAALEAVRPRFVVCHRNTFSIARSLLRWLPSLSQGVWLAGEYVARAAHMLGVRPEWPVLHVSYEEMLSDPQGQAARLARFAELDMPAELVAEFVDPALRNF